MRPIAEDGVVWSVGRLVCRSVCHDREPCKNGWTDTDFVWDVDSGGPNKTCNGQGLDPHTKDQFWGRKGVNQDIPGHVRRSIYSKRLSGRQHRYSVDADWGVLDEGAHWRNLGNTTELSVCGGDAALSNYFGHLFFVAAGAHSRSFCFFDVATVNNFSFV